MTDEKTAVETPAPEAAPQADPWTDVVRSLDDFGRAVTAWVSAVREDPDNRRRAKELQSQLDAVGRQIGDSVDAAVRSDVAQQMGSAAMATGEVMIGTAKRVGDEVSPFVASALRSAAEGIRGAAERIEAKATQEGPGVAATGPGEASAARPETTHVTPPEPPEDREQAPPPAPPTDYIP